MSSTHSTERFPFGCALPTKIHQRSGPDDEAWNDAPWVLKNDSEGQSSLVLDYGRAEGGVPFFRTSKVCSNEQVVEIEIVYSETFDGLDRTNDNGRLVLPVANAINTCRRQTHSFTPSRQSIYIEDPCCQRSQRYQQIILKTPNSSISFSLLGFRTVRPAAHIKSTFSCSNETLNRIWQDGVRTVDMCTVEAGEIAETWEVTERGTIIRGQQWNPCRQGTRWGDKVVEFEVQILRGGASWGIHMVANGLIFCLDVDTRSLTAFEGPANASVDSRVIPRGSWPLNSNLNLTDWLKIICTAGGTSVSVEINGHSIATMTNLKIQQIQGEARVNTGSVAFGGPSCTEAIYRSLSVKGEDGSILYENSFMMLDRVRIMADFLVGTNTLPYVINGARQDHACSGSSLFVMGRSISYSTGNFDAILGSINLLTSHQSSSGYLGNQCPVQAPLHVEGTEPPTYAFHSLNHALLLVVAVKDYWMHSGDGIWVTQVWERLEILINFTAKFTDSRGLIVATPSLSLDWFAPGGPIHGASGKINLAFYDALRAMSTMASALRKVDHFTKRAEALKSTILAHLWDDATGSMRMSDVISPTGICQDINGYAVSTGITPAHNKTGALLAAPSGFRLPLAYQGIKGWDQYKVVSPHASGYAAEALFICEQGEAAVRLIERVWGPMVDQKNPNHSGGHWELLNPNRTPFTKETSLVHGSSTWPVHLLPRYLTGLEPIEAGCSRFKVKPVIAGLDSVDVKLASKSGDIGVSLRIQKNKGTGQIFLTIPTEATAEVYAPQDWFLTNSDDFPVPSPIIIPGKGFRITIGLKRKWSSKTSNPHRDSFAASTEDGPTLDARTKGNWFKKTWKNCWNTRSPVFEKEGRIQKNNVDTSSSDGTETKEEFDTRQRF